MNPRESNEDIAHLLGMNVYEVGTPGTGCPPGFEASCGYATREPSPAFWVCHRLCPREREIAFADALDDLFLPEH